MTKGKTKRKMYRSAGKSFLGKRDGEKKALDSQTIMLANVNLSRPDALPMKVKRNNTFVFANTVQQSNLTSAAVSGSEVDATYQFELFQLDGVTAITGMFDQYRILQVSVTFTPAFNEALVAGSPTAIGTLTTAIDYDDATSTSASALRQKESCVVTPCYQSITRTFTPHIAVAAYNSSFAGFGNLSRVWIDSASSTVQHYGLKAAMIGFGPTSIAAFSVWTRMVIEVRQVQ